MKVVLIALLLLCTSCASRITGPRVVESGSDIHGEGHTLGQYIAIVEAMKADPDSRCGCGCGQ